MALRFLVFTGLLLAATVSFAQNPLTVTSKTGQYSITPLPGWRVTETNGSMYIYAPADGAMDPWDEKLDISTAEANDNTIDEAFDFFIGTDFPETYLKFTLIKKGEEVIHGVPARWVEFTFSGFSEAEGANENNSVSASLHVLFYLLLKDNTLYFINGVTEKSLFNRFEPDFRAIIRTFQITE